MNTPVISIDSYDAEKRSLTLAFRDGVKYTYAEVSPDHYQALKDAPDLMNHFRTRIQANHPYRKCPR